ncbi:hypothetical protein NPIL_93021, partial [Nephila pilipes]
AQLYLNEPTFRVAQVVPEVGYSSMGVVRPSSLPEGSNRSRAELDTPAPACHVSGVAFHQGSHGAVYAIVDIKKMRKLCLVTPNYQKQSGKTIRNLL